MVLQVKYCRFINQHLTYASRSILRPVGAVSKTDFFFPAFLSLGYFLNSRRIKKDRDLEMTRQKLFLNIKYYFFAAQLSLDQTAATSLNIPEA